MPSWTGGGVFSAIAAILRAEGPFAFYRGLPAALLGVAPYSGLNFATYDLLKGWAYAGGASQSAALNMALGAGAGSVGACPRLLPQEGSGRRLGRRQPGREQTSLSRILMPLVWRTHPPKARRGAQELLASRSAFLR